MSRQTQKTAWLLVSIILYVIAMFLPAADIPDIERGIPIKNYGLEILYTGWLGLLDKQPAWFANPCYIIALFTYGSKASVYFTYAALILALLSPLFLVMKLYIGFYLWLASFIALQYGNNLHDQILD